MKIIYFFDHVIWHFLEILKQTLKKTLAHTQPYLAVFVQIYLVLKKSHLVCCYGCSYKRVFLAYLKRLLQNFPITICISIYVAGSNLHSNFSFLTVLKNCIVLYCPVLIVQYPTQFSGPPRNINPDDQHHPAQAKGDSINTTRVAFDAQALLSNAHNTGTSLISASFCGLKVHSSDVESRECGNDKWNSLIKSKE